MNPQAQETSLSPCITVSHKKEGAVLLLYVQPRASKSEIVGEHDGRLKLRLCSPPVDNAANHECIRFFSKLLHMPRGCFRIVQGESSRRKSLLIEGVTVYELSEKLSFFLQND